MQDPDLQHRSHWPRCLKGVNQVVRAPFCEGSPQIQDISGMNASLPQPANSSRNLGCIFQLLVQSPLWFANLRAGVILHRTQLHWPGAALFAESLCFRRIRKNVAKQFHQFAEQDSGILSALLLKMQVLSTTSYIILWVFLLQSKAKCQLEAEEETGSENMPLCFKGLFLLYRKKKRKSACFSWKSTPKTSGTCITCLQTHASFSLNEDFGELLWCSRFPGTCAQPMHPKLFCEVTRDRQREGLLGSQARQVTFTTSGVQLLI